MAASCLFTDTSSEYLKVSSVLGLTDYPFTFASWFSGDVSNNNILVSIAYDNVSDVFFNIRINDSNVSIVTRNTTFISDDGTTTLVDDTWYHICGVWRTATDREVYLNGISEATGSTSVSFSSSFNAMGIGATVRSTPIGYAQGKLAFPQVYNKDLTVQEIQEIIYNPNGIGGSLIWDVDLLNPGASPSDFKDKSASKVDCDAGTVPAASYDGPPVSFPQMQG